MSLTIELPEKIRQDLDRFRQEQGLSLEQAAQGAAAVPGFAAIQSIGHRGREVFSRGALDHAGRNSHRIVYLEKRYDN